LIAAAVLLVAQSAAATQASYQITTLKQEQARLSAEHDQLRAQLAADRAANRVATAAVQLGLSSRPVAVRPRDRLADCVGAAVCQPGPSRGLGRRVGGAGRRDRPPTEFATSPLTGRRP